MTKADELKDLIKDVKPEEQDPTDEQDIDIEDTDPE